MQRGKIRNRKQAQQIKDFSGLRWGKITPTDIDGFFEINNQVFVFIEIKYGGRELPYGQKLAFERLVDTIEEKKSAILIVAEHETPLEEDIDAANSIVLRYRFRGKWIYLKQSQTLKDFCDSFIEISKFREEA